MRSVTKRDNWIRPLICRFIMEKTAYIYFGNKSFHKFSNFINEPTLALEFSKCNIFNSVNSSSVKVIDDVSLGWSFIVYRSGNKFYHVGYPFSKGDPIEVFKSLDKEYKISCGETEVYAFSKQGDIFHYSTHNIDKIFSCTADKGIKDISTGATHTAVIYDDGTVSLLNISENTPLIPLHFKVPIVQASCGKEHVLFLSKTGQVFSYGCGSRGQLGLGGIDPEPRPALLDALDGIKIKSVSCGGWHSVALSDTGDLYTWGWNESGQLGFPCTKLHDKGDLPPSEVENIRCLPKPVKFEEEKWIVSVSCGTRHTVALTEDSEVWSWGWNEYDQLGYNSKVSVTEKPCKVSLPNGFVPRKIKCAFWSTLIFGTLSV